MTKDRLDTWMVLALAGAAFILFLTNAQLTLTARDLASCESTLEARP